MKRKSRYARTSRLLVFLLCALLLAGMMPSFGALGDAKNRKGNLVVSLLTSVDDLPKNKNVTYTIYKVGDPAPETAAGWKFDENLSESTSTKEITDIIEAKLNSDMQVAVNKLADAMTDKYKVDTLNLSNGSATSKDLDYGIYLGVLTEAPEGMTSNPALVTIPMWNADKTNLQYTVPVSVKDTYTGDLTISKTVVSADKADESKIYSFTIALLTKDGKPFTPDQKFKTSAGTEVEFKAGVATLSVQGGHSRTIFDLPHGTRYTVTEVDSQGLLPDQAVINGSIAGASQTAAFTNTQTGVDRKDNEVTVTKTDGSEQISGAEFTLYDDETPIKKYTGGQFKISTDDLPQSILPAVGDTKELTLKETSAPVGYTGSSAEYKVVIAAKDATAMNSTRNTLVTTTTYTITIEDKNAITVVNTPIPGVRREDDAVTVTKTDGVNQLPGAIFTLYDGEKEITTFEGGQFEISTANEKLKDVLPAAGGSKKLTLKETTAPTGYKASTTAYTVEIKASEKSLWSNGHAELVTITTYSITINGRKSISIDNTPITDVARKDNEVTVTKTDGTAQISGATFTLYDGDNVITTYTKSQFTISTADDALKDILPAVGGTKELTLKETSVPTGYNGSDTEYKVVITASDSSPAWNAEKTKQITTTTYNISINGQDSVVVVNTPITDVSRKDSKVTVTKTDGSAQIEGATFTLYDGDKAISTYTGKQFEISTADEKLQSILPEADKVRTLTLKETTAPTGYTGSSVEYKVEITASESTAWNADHTKEITTTAYTISIDGKDALTVPNEPITGVEEQHGAVTVYKVNDSQQALAGAEFTLYSGGTAIKTYGGANVSTIVISTKDTELSKYLPAVGESAKLTLKETKAPAGYTATDQTYEVVLSTSSSQGWNRDHTKYITTTTYGITIGDGKNSVTVVNTVTPTTTPPDDDVPPAPPAPTPEPTVDITGTKVWVDESNAHKTRPDSITVTLLADGSPVNATPSWSKSGDRWTFTFSGLPKFNSGGNEITYSVQETPVQGYKSSVSGMTITNSLEPQEPKEYTEISGAKTWNDNGNESGKRPTNITVRLYRDGVEIESRTVTAGTDWKYTFGSLPVDDGYGNIYAYEVREDGVKGYYTRVDDMSVTNSVIDGSTPPTPTTEDGTPPPEGLTPNVPQKPEDVPERKTGTPVPHFEEKTDEELEELFDMFGYGTPLYGMLGTGDQVPVWVWICAGAGALALILFIATGRKKKKAK